MLDAALSYAERGWPVFPVGPDKRPLTRGGFKDATTDPEIIRRWWTEHPEASIGSPVRPGHVIFDIDPRNGGEATFKDLVERCGPLPATVTTLTGGAGRHLYFTVSSNGANVRASLGPGVDVKIAEKGYTILPPSPHASGRRYAWEPYCEPEEQTIAELPETWAAELRVNPGRVHEHGGGVDPAEVLKGVPEGERDETLFRYTCSLRARGGFSKAEARELILLAAARCTPPFDPKIAAEKVDRAWTRPENETRAEIAQEAGEAEPEAASPERAETLRLTRVAPGKIEWLWPGRIPRGTITQLDGDPDLAKSTISIDLAARGSRENRTWPDEEPCGGPWSTLLLSAEDPAESVIRPRFDEAGGDPDMVTLLRAVRRGAGAAADLFSLATDIAILEEAAKKIPRLALIVIDPLTAYLGAVNSWKDQEVRRVLAPLAALAERLRLAVLLIRHLNKATKLESVLYRGGGSIGIIGAARSGLLAVKDPDDESEERRLLATYKHNLAQRAPTLAYRPVPSPSNPEVPVIRWEGVDPRSAEQINAAAGETREQKTARGDARHFLRELLADGPVAAEDGYAEGKKAGFSQRTLERACADLGVKKGKTGLRTGWTWSLQ